MSPFRWGRIALAAAVACLWCSPSPAQIAATPRADYATSELLVFITPGQSAADLARDFGLTPLGHLADAPNIVRLQAASVESAFAARVGLAADQRVRQAFVQYDNPRTTTAFTPNDPFFFPGTDPPVGGPGSTGNAVYPGQWHLVNAMPAAPFNDPSIDVRVKGAWDRDLTGNGVVIGIVDNAVQVGHPDLSPNNRTDLSHDFVSNDSDPSPVGTEVAHGTAVAGVAAARGGNGIGGTGAAPHAGLAGFRTNLLAQALQDAYSYRNDAIKIKNHSYAFVQAFPNAAADEAILAAGAAQGVIHVFAAGNERGRVLEDANKTDLQNSPHVITVAALGSDGKFATYSSFGANVFVTAPSSSDFRFAVTTTDRTGSAGYNATGAGNFASSAGGGTGLDYTNDFGGTSSAAPLVSGVIALAVEARNTAGFATDVRVVKHLLALTSRMVDATGGGWQTNKAGFHFNQNYGFGLIDADALTRAATQYSGVTALTTHTVPTSTVGETVPDNNAFGASHLFSVSAVNPQPLEEVQITLDITHPRRGQLEAYLTSPSGTRGRLFKAFPSDSGDDIRYEFVSNEFWGESPNGTWTLTVADLAAGNVGTWNSFSATFRMGTLVPVPEPATVGLAGALGLAGWAARRRRRRVTAA
ncbi:MAG TPA: S8 family serine peptidase [Fimbriiglobus sp.]|nr:S8 family serine peptidase [Fimbriiglobus sp.]